MGRRLLMGEIKCMAHFASSHQKDTKQKIETLITSHESMLGWAITKDRVDEMKYMIANDALLQHAHVIIRTVGPTYDPYSETPHVPKQEKKPKNGRGKAAATVLKECKAKAAKRAASKAGNIASNVGKAVDSPELEPIFVRGVHFHGGSQLGSGHVEG